MERIRLDLPLLLPDVTDARDECVTRLIELLAARRGVEKVHVSGDGSDSAANSQLCLHYDPEQLSLGQIESAAKLAGAKLTNRFSHEVRQLREIGSEDAGQRIETRLRQLPGVTAASVNFPGQVVRIEYDRERTTAERIDAELNSLGAEDSTGTEHPPGKTGPPVGWYARNKELAWSLAAGALLLTGWLLTRTESVGAAWIVAIYAASYAFGAWDNLSHFVKDLSKGHFYFNIDLLMVVAAAGAAAIGAWAEGALLLFLFSLGHALEHYAMGRARNAISALAELSPSRAIVIRDGQEKEIAIEEVRTGDRVIVKPSERISVDGTVVDGKSSVNQAPITGESVPVAKVVGEKVFAGSVNGDGALVVEVTSAIGDRTLDRVIKLVSEAQTQKAPTQQFTDKFERLFVPMVLVADALLITIPPLIGLWTWSESFYRAMALLVAASPCALALGTPAAVLSGIAQAARKGILIKGGAHLEALGEVTVLALDKTGTITIGQPAVTDVVPAAGITEDELLAAAAAVEKRSQHPLAKAVLSAAADRKLDVALADDLEAVTGMGVRATVDGKVIEAGQARMFGSTESAAPTSLPALIPQDISEAVSKLEASGRTTIIVRSSVANDPSGYRWLGVLGIADEPRKDVRETLNSLRALGIQKIVMLTGDNAGIGNAVGKAVGVDEVKAGLMPEDKVREIKELAASGKVAMVGDGVNDAPALAHATVGIAMGAAGTAAALETADVALMGDDLAALPLAIGLSRQSRRIIRQNLYLSLGVIALLIIVTVTGVAGLGPAVMVHEGSTLVVIANALRLLAYK